MIKKYDSFLKDIQSNKVVEEVQTDVVETPTKNDITEEKPADEKKPDDEKKSDVTTSDAAKTGLPMEKKKEIANKLADIEKRYSAFMQKM